MVAVESNWERFPFSRSLIESVREPVLLLDEQLRVLAVNQPYLAEFDDRPGSVENQSVFDLPPATYDPGEFREGVEQWVRSAELGPVDFLIEENIEIPENADSEPNGCWNLRLRRVNALEADSGEFRVFVVIEEAAGQENGAARQARIASLFHKAHSLPRRSANVRETLVGCVEIVCELSGWPVGHVCVPHPDDPDRLIATDDWHRHADGIEGESIRIDALCREAAGLTFGRGEVLPGQIWESGEPAWIVDVQNSDAFRRREAARRAGVRGAFGFPVKIKDETIAVLEFFSARPQEPDRTLLALTRSLGELVGDGIDHARLEARLRRGEEEFGQLFEASPVGILLLSPDGRVQRANTRLLDNLGYAAHDFVGHALADFLLDKSGITELARCCECGERLELETRIRARDCSTRHVMLTATAYRVEPNVAYIRCFVHDITARKRDESELARLAAIVRSSDDAIIGLSPDGMVTSWNPGAERLYGYVADDVVGGSISRIIPAEREEETTRLLETVKSGERIEQYETVRLHRDGRRIHVSMTISPIRAAPGRGAADHESVAVTGAAVIERDISERKRVAAEIRRAVQEAERANRAKGEFLANVSHELRTPMNAIIGMTELALDEPIPADVRDYLQTANDSAEMLLRLLNDILDFSRIEAGHFEIDEAEFSLHETLEETVKTLAVRADEKGLEVGLRIAHDVPDRLVGDPVRLRQVVTNLANNAIKFTETGEVEIAVEINHLQEQDASLHFRVRDTGIGISQADQERIFSPFAQVDATSTRSHGGAGLGLAICRELVAMMHGRMWIESEPNEGTTFHFLAQFQRAEAPDAIAPPSDVVRELKGLPVLIVDDNATNRRILGEALENWQMAPVLAPTAEEALERLRSAEESNGRFPLIFVDGLMPGTDGFTLVEQIRAEARFPGETVMMLSGSERRAYRDRCKRLDIAGLLEKPITQSELLDSIVTTLQGPPLEEKATEETSRIGGADQPLAILLVEDTPANRKVVTAVLNKRGHSVTVATDGHEAVKVCRRGDSFDLILMDVQMPNMDGYQATGMIREFETGRRRRTPIIAMTAHAMRGDRERCLAAGMDAYLSKPIDVRRMLKLIERIALRARRRGPRPRVPEPRDEFPFAGEQKTPASETVPATGPEPATSARRMEPTPQLAEGGTMRGESDTPLFDKAAALERLGGDEQLLGELSEYFREDSESLLSTIADGAHAEDWPAVRRAAHSLKGLAANFSAAPATEAARSLEEAAAAEETETARARIDATRREIERLREALAEAI